MVLNKQIYNSVHVENNISQNLSTELVDRELVRSFLSLSPEQRVAINDNTIRTILELRDGIQNDGQK